MRKIDKFKIYLESGFLLNLLCFALLVAAMVLTALYTRSFLRVILFAIQAFTGGILLIYTFEAHSFAKYRLKAHEAAKQKFNEYLAWQKNHPNLDKEWYVENILKEPRGGENENIL